jgi:hypothetical protein
MANHTVYMAVYLTAYLAGQMPRASQARGSESRPAERVGTYHKGVAIPAPLHAPTPPRKQQ